MDAQGRFMHVEKTTRGHNKEAAIYKLRKEASRETTSVDTLI